MSIEMKIETNSEHCASATAAEPNSNPADRKRRWQVYRSTVTLVAFAALVFAPQAYADAEVMTAHACTVNAKQMGASFRALSLQMRAPKRDNAAISAKLGEAEVSYDAAREACAPIPEMTSDMELVGEELARIRASLGLSPRAN